MKDEEKERQRRQKNIILYNVPENMVGKTDKIIVEEIIKNDLGVRDVKIEEKGKKLISSLPLYSVKYHAITSS